MNKDDFLYDINEEEMEDLLSGIDEKDFNIDELTRQRIENKVLEAIKPKRKSPWKRVGIAAAVILLLSMFNPTVQAYMKRILYFVPGFGVVQENDAEMLMGINTTVMDEHGILNSEPQIFGDEQGVKISFMVDPKKIKIRPPYSPNNLPFSDFVLYVNGNLIDDIGYLGSMQNEKGRYFLLGFGGKINTGDKLEFINSELGVTISAELDTMIKMELSSIAHSRDGDITVYAIPYETDGGYDLYLFMNSAEFGMRPISVQAYKDEMLYFINSEGEKVKVDQFSTTMDNYYPQLQISGKPGKGELVFNEFMFTYKASTSFEVDVPEKGVFEEVNKKISIGNIELLLEKIYWSEVHNGYQIQFSWDEDINPTFFGYGLYTRSLSGGTTSTDHGEGRFNIVNEAIKDGKVTITITNPTLLYKDEFRIPLNLQ